MSVEQLSISHFALLFGILHALEPGHGKTALFAYLASGKKTWTEGIVISLMSALTHTIVVFIVAYFSHLLVHHATHQQEGSLALAHTLKYISGTIILLLGLWLLKRGLVDRKKTSHSCNHCQGEHDHEHSHRHHVPMKKRQKLFVSGLLGIATGLIPCPSVVVAYLSGVATGDFLKGVNSVLFFGAGMAISLMLLVSFFRLGGDKLVALVRGRSNKPLFRLNWSVIQGSLFILIGLFHFI